MLERHLLEKFGIAAQQGFVLLAGITPTIINKIIFIFPEVIIKQFESPDSYVVRLLEKLFQSAGREILPRDQRKARRPNQTRGTMPPRNQNRGLRRLAQMWNARTRNAMTRVRAGFMPFTSDLALMV